MSGLASEADCARLGMDESLRRMAPFAVAVKQALAGYGLDLDASLAALDASLQSQTGDTAQVRMRYLLGGQPVDTVVEVEPIGRASCRERVCQYVSSSVVAGTLKKKK